MARVEVRIRSGLTKIPAAARRKIELALDKAAADIEARAKTTVPVDTGALKNSIQAGQTGRDLERQVEAGQGYAAFVEFGTRRMAARPYLTPAFEAVRPAFERAVARAIEEAAREEEVR